MSFSSLMNPLDTILSANSSMRVIYYTPFMYLLLLHYNRTFNFRQTSFLLKPRCQQVYLLFIPYFFQNFCSQYITHWFTTFSTLDKVICNSIHTFISKTSIIVTANNITLNITHNEVPPFLLLKTSVHQSLSGYYFLST